MNQCVSHIKGFSDKQIEAGNKGTENKKQKGLNGYGKNQNDNTSGGDGR